MLPAQLSRSHHSPKRFGTGFLHSFGKWKSCLAPNFCFFFPLRDLLLIMHPTTPKLFGGHQTKNHLAHILARPILLPGKPSEPTNDTTKAWEQDPPEGKSPHQLLLLNPQAQGFSLGSSCDVCLVLFFGFFFLFFFFPPKGRKRRGKLQKQVSLGGQKSKEI